MGRPLGPGGIAATQVQLPADIAALVRDLAAAEDRAYRQIVIRAIRQYAALAGAR